MARSPAGAETYSAYPRLSPKLGKRIIPNTLSPRAKPVTPSATASTTPETSDPGMTGNATFGRHSGGKALYPSLRYQSGGLIPAARTRTSTSPGLMSGIGVEPDLARDVAPAQVGDHGSPDEEVGFCLLSHRLHHRDRQRDRVIGRQRSASASKGRPKTGSQEDWFGEATHDGLPEFWDWIGKVAPRSSRPGSKGGLCLLPRAIC